MGFKRRVAEPPRVDLTPMIDVVFLLLIFFMISTTFIEQPGLQIDLPQSTAQRLRQEERELRVYLSADGLIYLQKQPVSLELLTEKLAAIGPRAGKMTFLLMADKQALHGRVIQLMDLAKSAGFATLAIATDKPPIISEIKE